MQGFVENVVADYTDREILKNMFLMHGTCPHFRPITQGLIWGEGTLGDCSPISPLSMMFPLPFKLFSSFFADCYHYYFLVPPFLKPWIRACNVSLCTQWLTHCTFKQSIYYAFLLPVDLVGTDVFYPFFILTVPLVNN